MWSSKDLWSYTLKQNLLSNLNILQVGNKKVTLDCESSFGWFHYYGVTS